MLRDFPARAPDSTRNTAAVPSDRSVTGPPGGGKARGGRWRARPGEGRGGPTETGRARLRNSLSPVGRRGEAPQGGRARAKASAGVR